MKRLVEKHINRPQGEGGEVRVPPAALRVGGNQDPPEWGQREFRADARERHGAACVPKGLLGSNTGQNGGQSRERGGEKKPNGGKKNKKPYNRGFVLLWLVLI